MGFILSKAAFSLLLIMPILSSMTALSQIVDTYVGPHLPQDGALATTQSIDAPESPASDGSSGFYVASSAQNRVYRILADGSLIHIAGTGQAMGATTARLSRHSSYNLGE
jgi:hypothetical protein